MLLRRFCKSVALHTGTPTGLGDYAGAVETIVDGVAALIRWLVEGGASPTDADLARLRAARDEFWPNAEPAARNWADNVVSLSQFPALWEAAQAFAGTGNPQELALRMEAARFYVSAPISWCWPTLVGGCEVTTTRNEVREAFDLPAPCPPLVPRWACSTHNNRNTPFASDPRELIPWHEIEQRYPWAWPLLGFLCEAARQDARLIVTLLTAAESVVDTLQGEVQQKAREALAKARRDAHHLHLLCAQLRPIFCRAHTTEDVLVRALRSAAEPFFGPTGTGLIVPPAVFGTVPKTATECFGLANRFPAFRDEFVGLAVSALHEANWKALRENRRTFTEFEARRLTAESEAIVVTSASDRDCVARAIAPKFRSVEVAAHLRTLS